MDDFGKYIDDSEYEEFESEYDEEMQEMKMKKPKGKVGKVGVMDYDFTKDYNKLIGTTSKKKNEFGDIRW